MDPIPTVHRYQTFLIEDTHKYPDQDISVIYETQDAIFLNDLKGRLTNLCIAHNGESQKDNPYYYKEFNCPQQRGSLTVGYQKKVPAGRIKPAFFVSNFWFLSIVFYCNVL